MRVVEVGDKRATRQTESKKINCPSIPVHEDADDADDADVDDAEDADVDGSLVVEAGDSSLDSSLGTDHFNAVQHSQQTFKKESFGTFSHIVQFSFS